MLNQLVFTSIIATLLFPAQTVEVVVAHAATLQDTAKAIAAEYHISYETLDNLISSESKWNPDIVSPTGDYGLAAINLRWHSEVTKEQALDPDFALRFAAKVIQDGKEGDQYTVCNCYQYIKAVLGEVGSITSNSTPRKGAIAIFDYKGVPHYGIVVEVKQEGFMIREANYIHCKTDVRLVKWDDKSLKGFFMPTTSS